MPGKNCAVEPLDIDRLKILMGETRPKDIEELVGPDALPFVVDPSRRIVRSDDEMCALEDSPAPACYMDDGLRTNPSRLLALVTRLHEVGLIGFRRSVKAFIGFFAVGKKDGMQRLVIDARPPNFFHRRAPYSTLATVGGISEIDMSRATLDSRSDVPAEPHGLGVDFQDGFYQLRFRRMAAWFGIDSRVRAADFGVREVYNDETESFERVAPSDRLWLVFEGLAMGWSWALFLCHSCLTRAMIDSALIFNPAISLEEAHEQLRCFLRSSSAAFSALR
jgi:hypothetical protein